jgi:hypothetical protein
MFLVYYVDIIYIILNLNTWITYFNMCIIST